MRPLDCNRTPAAPNRRAFLQRAIASSATALGVSLAGRAAKKKTHWQAHPVARVPHGYQVAAADVNGDERPEIFGISSVESIVEWYENPSWQSRRVTTQTRKNISLAPLFRENYPARGLALAANFALEQSRSGGDLWWAEPAGSPEAEWSLHWIGEIPTAHRLRWADLDGDGRLELVVAPILGPGAVAPDYSVGAPLTWFEMPEPLLRGHLSALDREVSAWTPHLIDDTLTVVHGIQVVDWDGDGRDEILTASFEGVHLFRPTGRGKDLHWTKTRLGAGDQESKPRRGASEIGVGKLRGRRFLATIEPWHGDKVAVYFEIERGKLWERRVIDSSFRDGHALAVADFDGDGNDEIVAGFRGPGTSLYLFRAADAKGAEWKRETLDTQMAASGVVVADLNGDGRPDVAVIGAATANVKWYENLGDRS